MKIEGTCRLKKAVTTRQQFLHTTWGFIPIYVDLCVLSLDISEGYGNALFAWNVLKV